jgi:predicted nucleotidyltransferase
MWIYTFGSLVRGEIDMDSDIDIISICSSENAKILPRYIQKYSKNDYLKIHTEGDLFAHHLYKESRLIYSSDGLDLIQSIGRPGPYINWNGCGSFAK